MSAKDRGPAQLGLSAQAPSGIGVLDKTVAILDAVGDGPATLRDLVDRTGISRATAHRLAQGMEVVGLLRRDRQGEYRLGVRLIGLGRMAADAYPLATVAVPVLRTLRDATGESTQLYVVDGDERLCVAAVDSTNELRTIVGVGSRLPMGVGSAARALTADTNGYFESVAERAPGVASVSAPVRRDGEVVAAVSVSGPIDRTTEQPGKLFGNDVVDAAAAIEAALDAR